MENSQCGKLAIIALNKRMYDLMAPCLHLHSLQIAINEYTQVRAKPPASATAQTYPPSVLQPQSTGTMSVLQPQSTGTMSIMTQRGPTPTMSPPPRVPSAAVADPFASGAFNVPHSARMLDIRTNMHVITDSYPPDSCEGPAG